MVIDAAPDKAAAPADEDEQRGYYQYSAATVLSTNPDPTDAPAMFPDLATRARNQRWAFAVVGALVGQDIIEFNFADPEWSQKFELAVMTAADTLNRQEMKV